MHLGKVLHNFRLMVRSSNQPDGRMNKKNWGFFFFLEFYFSIFSSLRGLKSRQFLLLDWSHFDRNWHFIYAVQTFWPRLSWSSELVLYLLVGHMSISSYKYIENVLTVYVSCLFTFENVLVIWQQFHHINKIHLKTFW